MLKLRPREESVCQSPDSQLFQLMTVQQLSSEAWNANLPLLSQYPPSAPSSPAKIIYPLCLARAMWHLQILPGRWGPWAKSGGQSRWRWEESPTGFFPVWAPQLPEQLSLTESHGLVGVGAGRQEGPAREEQKVPEACTAAALLR